MDYKFRDKIVYQIYPLSFMDSTNDGTGDIKGIISRLDYLKDLGINYIWLSPVYLSPGDDNGYDISDYKKINPLFGTMEDMDLLISRAKESGISIMMDLVINHTSDEHEWFKKSRDPESPYRDYYFWRKGRKNGPPSNWTSFFGGSAWEYDKNSDEYYLHLFSKKQPDLNHRNPLVTKEIKDIMKFWLDKGVEGFRCDVINIIWKSSLENGRKRLILTGREHYLSRPEMFALMHRIKEEVFKKYKCMTVGETVFINPSGANMICDKRTGGLDMVFSFEHMECDQIIVKWFKKNLNVKKFFKTLSKWQKNVSWTANYLENHDQPRSISRFIKTSGSHVNGGKSLAVLLLSQRGTPFIYQGQEIGMTDSDISDINDIRDVESKNIYSLALKLKFPKKTAWNMIKRTGRDNARTPVQWDDGENGGFTKGTPWIRVNDNSRKINVKFQENDENSLLSFYKKLIHLRKTNPILIHGKYREIKITRKIFVFERYLEKEGVLRIIINLSPAKVKFKSPGEVLISAYPEKKYNGCVEPYGALILKMI